MLVLQGVAIMLGRVAAPDHTGGIMRSFVLLFFIK
jgi:hypothetical protein